MRLAWPRDKAEDDPSWMGVCPNCDGIGYTEAAAFMCLDGERPEPCPACDGTGRA